MPDAHRFALFLAASAVLAITPGPGLLYVLARTVAGGQREGILSSLGTFLGGLVHVLAAATGLSLVLATSAMAFSVVKYAGAAYLIYLGMRLVLTSGKDEGPHLGGTRPAKNPFWQGIATEVLNPKTALFFLAFIPQFVVHGHGSMLVPFLVLGSITVSLNTTCDLTVVCLAAPISLRLQSSARLRRRQRLSTGLVLVGLGTYLAVSDTA